MLVQKNVIPVQILMKNVTPVQMLVQKCNSSANVNAKK